MNTTIDLKTAKTIEAMNQKVNHMDTAVTDFFNKMSDVLERQLGDDKVYAAVIAPEIELTITPLANVRSYLPCRTVRDAMSKQRIEACYSEHSSTIFSEMLGEDEEYLRLKKAKRAAEEALQSVISKEAWNQYLALDEICNELECARYKAMYLTGAADYEKISK